MAPSRSRWKSSPSRRTPTATRATKYAWMNAAYAMAANVNRAFKEYGWTVRIRGVQSGGEVINLPTHTFPTDDGGVDFKCPTEIAITDRREAEISKSGLISIIHRKNTDKAAFIGAQSIYKPRKSTTRWRRRPPTTSRPAFLTCSRFALRALSQVHGARQDRRRPRKRTSCRSGSTNWITALCRRRSQEFERGDQGAAAASGGQGHCRRTRRTRAIIGQFLSAAALPARRHGYRHQSGLENSWGKELK